MVSGTEKKPGCGDPPAHGPCALGAAYEEPVPIMMVMLAATIAVLRSFDIRFRCMPLTFPPVIGYSGLGKVSVRSSSGSVDAEARR
jgi:hypothetical protein